MIEHESVTVVRCDACGQRVPSGSPKASLFTKDFCSYCACEILSDLGKKPILDVEEFLEIVDDYKHSFRIPKPGIALC
jgi:hypothetical protein